MMAMQESPSLAPRASVYDVDFPSIELETPSSPGLSESTGTLVELAHEARTWQPAMFVDGQFKLDLSDFAKSIEADCSTFQCPEIPRLETVQRKPAEPPRSRKRPRLDSLGTLAESDLLGVMNSVYDSLAASLANQIASTMDPGAMNIPIVAPYGNAAEGERSTKRRRVADPGVSATTNGGLESSGEGRRIGAYTPEERKARIARFLRKRQQRVWNHKVKYDCRKKLADNRPRIKGRFVRRCDVEAYEAARKAQVAKAMAKQQEMQAAAAAAAPPQVAGSPAPTIKHM